MGAIFYVPADHLFGMGEIERTPTTKLHLLTDGRSRLALAFSVTLAGAVAITAQPTHDTRQMLNRVKLPPEGPQAVPV